MMRLRKIETPQIAVAIPMVRAWLRLAGLLAWLGSSTPSIGETGIVVPAVS
jgi:hypothetical protein